jgi:hypothetical protein
VVAVGAAMIGLGGWLAFRGRLKTMIAWIAAGMVVIYVGHWSFFPYWDERKPIRDFAAKAAAIVKGDEVYHWSDPQAKVVFYFGRQVPAIQWQFFREVNYDGNRVGALTESWLLEHPARAPWILGYADPNTRQAPEELKRLGYEPVLYGQDIQDKKLLFSLFERVAATRPSAP